MAVCDGCNSSGLHVHCAVTMGILTESSTVLDFPARFIGPCCPKQVSFRIALQLPQGFASTLALTLTLILTLTLTLSLALALTISWG